MNKQKWQDPDLVNRKLKEVVEKLPLDEHLDFYIRAVRGAMKRAVGAEKKLLRCKLQGWNWLKDHPHVWASLLLFGLVVRQCMKHNTKPNLDQIIDMRLRLLGRCAALHGRCVDEARRPRRNGLDARCWVDRAMHLHGDGNVEDPEFHEDCSADAANSEGRSAERSEAS